MTYRTPVKDIRFALDNVADFDALERTGAYEDLSDDLVEAILEEMGRFCDEVIAPLNVESDKQGAAMVDGEVRSTPGFKEAYGQIAECARAVLDEHRSAPLTSVAAVLEADRWARGRAERRLARFLGNCANRSFCCALTRNGTVLFAAMTRSSHPISTPQRIRKNRRDGSWMRRRVVATGTP